MILCLYQQLLVNSWGASESLPAVLRNELRKVPYVSHIPEDGRIVFLQPYYDTEEKVFKMFVPQGDKLTWVFAEPAEMCYYAKRIMDESTDISVSVVDIVARYYSFEPTVRNLLRFTQDILNSSVVVEKYFIFLERFKRTKDVFTSSLVMTDVEYFFVNLRSLYDLLQQVLKDLWNRTARKKLPDSFSMMITKNEQELRNKYGLSESLITYFTQTKDFFLKCCNIRDSVIHRGRSVEIIYCLEEGFALQKDNIFHPNPLVSKFTEIWPLDKTKQNGLVSLLALFSYINAKTLENLDIFATALIQSITPPESISENYKVYIRGPYVHHLLKSHKYLNDQWASS